MIVVEVTGTAITSCLMHEQRGNMLHHKLDFKKYFENYVIGFLSNLHILQYALIGIILRRGP